MVNAVVLKIAVLELVGSNPTLFGGCSLIWYNGRLSSD